MSPSDAPPKPRPRSRGIHVPPVPIPRPVAVDRVMVERRARELASRSIKTASQGRGLALAMSMVDLTTLEGRDTPGTARAIAARALRPSTFPLETPVPPVAAVCVYPRLVADVAKALGPSPIRVASVATAFPSGQYPLELRLADVRAAIEAGADEIDMVIDRGAFLRGDFGAVAHEIAAVRQVCRAHVAPDRGQGVHETTHLKVILETGELGSLDAVRRASDLAIAAATADLPPRPSADAPPPSSWEDGCVFIKTSTGKVSPAASMPVTLVMLEAIRDAHLRTGLRIGMKPAGGIRSAKDALRYLVLVNETLGPAWLTPRLFRFGASSLVDDLVRQMIHLERRGYAARHDLPET